MDLSVADSLFYFTAWLFEVQTVVELALACKRAHFGKIAGEFLPGNVDEAELAHTGGVDDAAGVAGLVLRVAGRGGQIEHFCESRGMDTLSTPPADALGLEAQFGEQCIQEGGLPYPGVSAE